MYNLNLFNGHDKGLSILCFGAHADDIEIGCGGTILRLLSERPSSKVNWIILSTSNEPVREKESRESAEAFLGDTQWRLIVQDFRDGFLSFMGEEVKNTFESFKNEFKPDIIFTHHRQDLHQDHRLISQLTWNTFRDHLIFEYEIPKYDGGMGSPNFFVPLNKEICSKKVQNIVEIFESQRSKQWFTEEMFYSILRIRGMECNSPSAYAEGFYSHKVII